MSQLHGHVEAALGPPEMHFVDLAHGDQNRMQGPLAQLGLGHEKLPGLFATAKLGTENLERDHLAGAPVAGKEDVPHASGPESALHLVVAQSTHRITVPPDLRGPARSKGGGTSTINRRP